MVGTTSRGPYNMPGGEREVDELTYNPQADARPDNAAFNPDADNEDVQPIGARGASNQPTGRNWQQEDKETARSDETGQIPRGEVDDLMSFATSEGQGVQGRTRGIKNDAWKQERDLDSAFVDSGLADEEQDVAISRGTGA